MIQPKITLINAVKQGGETYLQYLLPFAKILESKGMAFQFLNMPDLCNISNETVAKLSGQKVTSVERKEIPFLDTDIVLCNDAYLGRLIDDRIESIFISHGSTAMPVTDPYYFSDWTGYWDGITSSSKSATTLCKLGLSTFRKKRKRLEIPTERDALRSNLRPTCIYEIEPLKMETLFDLSRPSLHNCLLSRNARVGLLPSALNVANKNSLYHSIGPIISSIKKAIPTAKISIRPYPADLLVQQVSDQIKKLQSMGVVEISDSVVKSDEFYLSCDLIITDVSTGGVSFMTRRGNPAVYYLPNFGGSLIEDCWTKQMQDKLFVSKTPEELTLIIQKIINMSEQQQVRFVEQFVRHEFLLNHKLEEFVFSLSSFDKYKRACVAATIDSTGDIDSSNDELIFN